ncbi:MAG TPA: glycosyltransferase family A protein [Tepidisphaeraceae bacterium]
MSAASPLVSVVIPTYKGGALLVETLESVFAQTFDDYEVIVINDGSPDDTLERLVPFQQRHGEKLRVVTQENAGIGRARNRGIDEARGRYIAFCDHDDLWMPEKLAVQVAYMQSHPQCAACGTMYANSPAPEKPTFEVSEVADEQGIVARPAWHIVRGRQVFQTLTLMVDAEKAKELRYATERGAIEDASYFLQLLGRGEYGIAGNRILAIYRVFEGNASKASDYYYKGILQLRRLERAGAFEALSPAKAAEAKLWIGQIARATAVTQITHRRRGRGLWIYLLEWPYQVKQLRFRFLLGYPVLLLFSAFSRK